jgi:hypothetical protein
MGTPQTSYSLNNIAGLPGQLYDNDESNFVDSRPASVILQPGQVVEMVSATGLLLLANGTGNPSSNVFWGVVLYKDSMEPGGYPIGVEVPIVRRGRIWALLDSGVTFTLGVAANYTHSSDASHGQGTFTNAAVSAVAGSEVSTCKAIWFKDGGLVGASPSVACVELNAP